MTPIINPWWFYLINLCAGLHNFTETATIIGAFVIIALWVLIFFEVDYDNYSKKIKNAKRFTIFWIVLMILSLIIPSQETLYQMFAACTLTPDNISVVGETAADAITFITETISAILIK